MNLTGEEKLGPYLTLTLLFFKEKKISSAQAIEIKKKI